MHTYTYAHRHVHIHSLEGTIESSKLYMNFDYFYILVAQIIMVVVVPGETSRSGLKLTLTSYSSKQ